MLRLGRPRTFRPFASGGGRIVAAILVTFALMFTFSVVLSIVATGRSRGRAKVVEIAARQRTLAERYVEDVLLVKSGRQADPMTLGAALRESAEALLDGGTAPGVHGDDDETTLPRASGSELRGQLTQEVRLANDLTAVGGAILANRPASDVQLTAGEHVGATDPIERIRVLAALTSNVSFNATGTIASDDDRNITNLLTMQVGLGIGGLSGSRLLAGGLIATTRRRTVHFRSLVNHSTDLVAVLGAGGCRYASRSLGSLVGRPVPDLLRGGFEELAHDDDRAAIQSAATTGTPGELVFRVGNANGDWRHLEARVTDLRNDRHVAGVVLNARDITERVTLERDLAQQAERDKFGGQLVEALEMADEENSAYDVVERAMMEVSERTPMELLLSDSSRAHLQRVATSPSAGAPMCPVQSPFACAAVRRGSAIVWESSDALNACPKLRDRESGSCSAACVPVGFMGRALGVLHVTAADQAPPSAEMVEQLTTLATQAGARIGTVRAFEKTQLQAATDGLTGLPNRRTVQMKMRATLKRGADFALAVADLDEFKKLNDKHGHDAGDRALRLFAQVCQRVLRKHDIVGRWGGEEFVLVLPGLDAAGAAAVAERLRTRLGESHGGNHPRFTASFGVTDSHQADSIEKLIRIADAALYESKAAGRDRVTVGVPGVEAVDLRSALEGDGVSENGDERHTTDLEADDHGLSHVALHEANEEDPVSDGIELR